MITLSLSHLIFLPSNQRIELIKERKAVEVIGVSIPVWWFQGSTSEPANEVFCKYLITNELIDYPPLILSTGYKINIPQIPEGIIVPKRPEPSKLATMSQYEKDLWSKENHCPAENPYDLLDGEDGGTKSLSFKRRNKHLENNKRFNVIHSIEIKDIEALLSSINL